MIIGPRRSRIDWNPTEIEASKVRKPRAARPPRGVGAASPPRRTRFFFRVAGFDKRSSRELARALGGAKPGSPHHAYAKARRARTPHISPLNSARDDVDACLKALRSSSVVSVTEPEPPGPKFAKAFGEPVHAPPAPFSPPPPQPKVPLGHLLCV